jgi:integrase
MAILPTAETQGELAQTGGWQKKMARQRYQRGSLRKRGKKNPVWELQWWADFITSDGTLGRKRESMILGFISELTRKQAWKLAAEQLRPLNMGKVTPQSGVTFGQFVERHFIPNFLPTVKLATQKKYLSTIRIHLLPAFGSMRLCEISVLHLQRFVLAKMHAGLGWESCDLLRNLLSKVFKQAQMWNFYAGDNPAAPVMLPEKTPVREKHVLNQVQIRALLDTLREPCRTMVLLGLLTGMRIGEILGLRWQDVDPMSCQLRIRQTIYRGAINTPKTKGSWRILPLPRVILRTLIAMRPDPAQCAEETLVFRTRQGTALSDTNLLRRHLKPAGRSMGAPWLSWHTLRRTHATMLQMAGGTLKDAQAQLGHTKLSTTLEIYTFPVPEHQRMAVENLAQMVTNGDELDQRRDGPPATTQQIQ